MRFRSDLDRRTFLKLGAAGTAVAAINPSIGGVSIGAKRRLSSPPTLADMAADRLTYRLRDLFNCPGGDERVGLRASREISLRDYRHFVSAVCLLRRA